MLCKSDHRYWRVLIPITLNQSGRGRHMCAGCACQQGYEDAQAGRRQRLNYDALLESQAGTARHKDCEEAYRIGYQLGLRNQPPS